MSPEFDRILEAHVDACVGVVLGPTYETVGAYAATWRLLRTVARDTFGKPVAFHLVMGLVRERYGRDGMAAVKTARELIDRLCGHEVFAEDTAAGAGRLSKWPVGGSPGTPGGGQTERPLPRA